MREPVGDHESERMLGARPDGRPVSARTVVLMPLKVDGKRSFFRGREVFGGAMVVGCCWCLFVVWVLLLEVGARWKRGFVELKLWEACLRADRRLRMGEEWKLEPRLRNDKNIL